MATKQGNEGKKGRTVEAVARRRQALELRMAGTDYELIGRTLGICKASAYKLVQRALKDTYREPADNVRRLELDRLDRLTRGLWARAKEGETDAIDRVLKLMDRRAKLLGLDAPAKYESTLNLAGFDWTDDHNPEATPAAPPGATGGSEEPGTVQGSSLRPSVGQDEAGSGVVP